MIEIVKLYDVILFSFRDYSLPLLVDKEKTRFDEPYLSAMFNKSQLLDIKEFIEKVENDPRCDSCWNVEIFKDMPCDEFTCKECGRLVDIKKELNNEKNYTNV